MQNSIKNNPSSLNDQNTWGIGTQCIQAGFEAAVGGPRVLPIYQTASYKYEDVDQVERLFALEESGFKYTRTGNPTLELLNRK